MTTEYPSIQHFELVVTDRVVEVPWVVSKVRDGESVLDVGSATSRYLEQLASRCRVHAIDLRPTRPQRSVEIVRGDLMRAPFRPGSFDVITCVSTIEHAGCDIYGQGPDEFGDEVLMRHMRALLRPGGRLLLTAPYGRRSVNAWFRVYDRVSLRRLIRGYQALTIEYRRREEEGYVACGPDELRDAGFDWVAVRSNGVVLAELTPAGGLGFASGRLSLRLRRSWARLRHRRRMWQFWDDVW